MITSVAGLRVARSRWLSAGKDPKLFDDAVTVLNAATTHADVVTALPSPTFSVKTTKDADANQFRTWQIYADGDLLLHYQLTEIPTKADADVTVIP